MPRDFHGGADPRYVLPDVLAPELDILFCGTAAGTVSAATGAYYAGPGNAFWRTLFDVGLTPLALQPKDYPRLREWNMGFTDLAKHVYGGDDVLQRSHIDAMRLRRLIVEYRTRIVACTSKRAAEEFVGRAVAYGCLAQTVATTRLFALPSPSGAARRYWNPAHWRALAFARLRTGDAGLE